MYCSKCGQLIKNESAAFCAYCGAKVPVPSDNAVKAAEPEKVPNSNAAFIQDIDDLDATVRVDDIPGKKYTLDHNQFRMPEPQEENVFDITPPKDEYDVTAGKVYDGGNKRSPFDDNGFFYSDSKGGVIHPGTDIEDATVKGRNVPSAQSSAYPSQYPPTAAVTGNAYTFEDNQDFNPGLNSFSAQGNFAESFTQAGNGPDNFFVQQTPVSANADSKKKMPASKLILVIVLCVLLFAAAVAGGIFAASAVMDNLILIGASASAHNLTAAAIYI